MEIKGDVDGVSALGRERDIEDGADALTWALLRSGELGSTTNNIYVEFATAFATLTEMATCSWGCRGGDHLIEAMIARFCNYGLAAVRLAAQGFYAESLALLRGMAEVATLLQLFHIDPEQMERWHETHETELWKTFSDGRVRQRITNLQKTPVVPDQVYKRLCELAVHPRPASIYASHFTIENRVHVGAHFSVVGVVVVFNQLALVVAPFMTIAAGVYGAPLEKTQLLEIIGETLQAVANENYDVTHFEAHFGSFRGQILKDMVEKRLDTMLPTEWEQLTQPVLKDVTLQAKLEAAKSQEEIKDLVFGAVSARLRHQIEQQLLEENEEWFAVASASALAEHAATRARQFALHPDPSS